MYLEKGQYFEAPKMPYFAKKASLPKNLNWSNFLQFHKPFFWRSDAFFRRDIFWPSDGFWLSGAFFWKSDGFFAKWRFFRSDVFWRSGSFYEKTLFAKIEVMFSGKVTFLAKWRFSWRSDAFSGTDFLVNNFKNQHF